MNNSSRSIFTNIPLKRWLLKVGPIRRRVLLKKFREKLVRLDLSVSAVREGLLQLSSRPFIRLNREATTLQLQIIHKRRMRGPKSKQRKDNHHPSNTCTKKLKLSHDNNNNNNNNYMGQENGRVPNFSYSRKKSTEEATAKELKKDSSKSGSSEKREEKRSKRQRWRLVKGENLNDITWRLVPIDMRPVAKSSGFKTLQLRLQLAEKKKKRDRLHAKFVEIFGKDIEPPDDSHRYSAPPNKSDSTNTREETESSETSDRKSPVFPTRFRKKRKTNRASITDDVRKSKTLAYFRIPDDSIQNAGTSDNASIELERDARLLQGKLATPQNDISFTSLIYSTETPDLETIDNPRDVSDDELVSSTATTTSINATTTTCADADEGSDPEREERTEGEFRVSESISESNNSSQANGNAAITVIETPLVQEQSVIVRLDINREESSLANSDDLLMLELKFATMAKTLNSTVITNNSNTLTIVDNENSETPTLPGTPILSDDKNLKNKWTDQFSDIPSRKGMKSVAPHLPHEQPPDIGSAGNLSDALDHDPKPSSTTDLGSSDIPESEMLCISDRLLGALDNIFLALDCRRRVYERQQTASKLAIKRNRQEEILKAEHDYESKLILFKDELLYLLKKLETWDAVLRFIAQGLDHRTPAGTEPFDKPEIDIVMREANIKIPSLEREKESQEVLVPPSVQKIVCTIDLTEDNWIDDSTINLCDSSTDPPKSENHITPKQELILVPSIAEVTTISQRQFEKIEQKPLVQPQNEYPCYVCSRTSRVACSRCAWAIYCSKTCQEFDWEKSHHATCVPLNGVIRSCK